jgi:polyhydroxybutyrate depolymerase
VYRKSAVYDLLHEAAQRDDATEVLDLHRRGSRRGRPLGVRSVTQLAVVVVLAIAAAVVVPTTSAAASKPTISWTTSVLTPNAAMPLAGLVRSSSSGTRTWKATGSCAVRASTLVVGTSGTCSVTVTIAGTAKTARGASTRQLRIAPAAVATTTSTTTVTADRSLGTTEGSLVTPDGRTRTYTLYVPATLPANAAVPLLVGLHGRGGSGAYFEMNSGFDALADQHGFIAVYPDGYTPPSPKIRGWNGGYCCGASQVENVDDVTFIRQLVHVLITPQAIDAKRVYVAGHSNGAIFGYRLGCELSDVVTAIGVQAGNLGVSPCTPARPVPFLHIHGTADWRAPIGGGVGAGIPNGIDQRSALSSVQGYAAAIGATSGPATAIHPSNHDVSVSTWTGRSPLAVVEYVVVTGATHAWMGHPQAPSQDAAIGKPYDGLDATAEIWAFVSRFSR